ncbi:MAG: hypothetical protein ACR2JI_09410 [Mycobacterium sp.]
MTSRILTALNEWFDQSPQRMIACSGGVDSMLLATVAHRHNADATVVVHDVTAAVPAADTVRVIEHATAEGWNLTVISSEEFADERYLSNPRDRCYYCKSHLYAAMGRVADTVAGDRELSMVLLSGANADDLNEFRPGLKAAAENGVRHPFLELDMGKAEIRSTADELGLAFADLPSSPCLASRLYTGTRVTQRRLRAVGVGEELVRQRTGIDVVRCRIDACEVRVEVPDADGERIDSGLLDAVLAAMRAVEPELTNISVDPRGYHPGRAFELVPADSVPVR